MRRYKVKNKKNRKIYIFALVLFLVSSLPLVFSPINCFKVTENNAYELLSIIINIFGTLLIVFQLQDSEQVACCDLMAEMNAQFINNKKIMRVYQILENEYRKGLAESEQKEGKEYKKICSSDLVAYCSIFEVLYEYIEHNVISIEQMDDLFGYRFFVFVHNRYFQEHELYVVPSSYANIFRLYAKWKEYRRQHSLDVGLIVRKENEIPDRYLEGELYLQEKLCQDYIEKEILLKYKGKTNNFVLRRLFPKDLKDITQLQKNIVRSISNEEWFIKSTEDEIIDSMLIDYVYGLFKDDKLIAMCICVLNRETQRNLCLDLKIKNYQEYITFDSIQVHPDYRGYGIHKFFLGQAEKVACKVGAKYIIATVSKQNIHSYKNFKDYEYIPKKENYKKSGVNRTLMLKRIIS